MFWPIVTVVPSDWKGALLWLFYVAGYSRTYLRLQVKCPLWTKFGVPRQVSINVPSKKIFTGICQWEQLWCMRTDGRRTDRRTDTTKLIGCFRDLANVPRVPISGVPRNFVLGGSTNSVEDRGQRERGYGECSPLVRGSGGSCNLVQEI